MQERLDPWRKTGQVHNNNQTPVGVSREHPAPGSDLSVCLRATRTDSEMLHQLTLRWLRWRAVGWRRWRRWPGGGGDGGGVAAVAAVAAVLYRYCSEQAEFPQHHVLSALKGLIVKAESTPGPGSVQRTAAVVRFSGTSAIGARVPGLTLRHKSALRGNC